MACQLPTFEEQGGSDGIKYTTRGVEGIWNTSSEADVTGGGGAYGQITKGPRLRVENEGEGKRMK